MVVVDLVNHGLLLRRASSNRFTQIKGGSGCNLMGARDNLPSLVFAIIDGFVGSDLLGSNRSRVEGVGVDNWGVGWAVINDWKVGLVGVDMWKEIRLIENRDVGLGWVGVDNRVDDFLRHCRRLLRMRNGNQTNCQLEENSVYLVITSTEMNLPKASSSFTLEFLSKTEMENLLGALLLYIGAPPKPPEERRLQVGDAWSTVQ